MLNKLKTDTKGYDIRFIPVESFDKEILSKATLETFPISTQRINWVDDDFMNDDSFEFDFEAFEIIDSGAVYLNPKHFSVEQLIAVLNNPYA